MSLNNFELKSLDNIVKATVESVKNNQEKIFDLVENVRSEYDRVERELKQMKQETDLVIKQVDVLETQWKKARIRLMEVHRDFKKYSEEEVKHAYEFTHNKQLELLASQEKEKILRLRRDHLEINRRNLKKTIQRSEQLVSGLGLMLNLLNRDLQDLNDKIGEVQIMQQLGLNIIKAQEEERRRVAREIHDGPAQSMANIVMRAEFCLKLLSVNNHAKVASELIALQNLVRLSLKDVRKIIFDLRPMVLDDLGLVPAIKRYLEEFKERHGILVEFLFFGQQNRLQSSLEVALFRVVQESLNNVMKHAQARQVKVKVEMLPNKVNILIKDNGVGFNPTKLTINQDKKEGYGLMGMRERIQLLKGTFNIYSTPGQGTEVAINIPVC